MASQAEAGDPFRATSDSGVSSSSLDAMGLSGMRTMERSESEQIRGQGIVTFSRSSGYAVGLFADVQTFNGTFGYENGAELAGAFSGARSSTLFGVAAARSTAFAAVD